MRIQSRFAAFLLSIVTLFGAASFVRADESPENAARLKAVREQLDTRYSQLVDLYKHLHSNPELSRQEAATAAKMANEMKSVGLEVTTGIGGHGLVGIMKNGSGPTVMIRTDLDGLPVTEKTGVPYASKVMARNREGQPCGVMHACGHDMHMTCWIGVAQVMHAIKDRWSGTLMFVGQPAEEIGFGAQAMIKDGLFKRFPKPDYALALHCDSRLKAGMVSFTEGLAMANVDTVDMVVKGKGGHGAAPHTTIDPIVLSAKIILDLQTIVSRELTPTDPAVVTVGSIHGGTKHNIIPNEVKLQLTVRTTKDTVRAHVLDAIKRIAKANADASRAPEPEVTVVESEFTPALFNDQKLTRSMVALFREVLGKDRVAERPPMMGGEDFSRYGREGVPVFLYFLGTIEEERWSASLKPGATPLPSMHSDSYWPAIEPSIRTGVETMSMAVLKLVGK